MNNLILSKYLYTKAESIYSPADTFSCGLSVSMLQDSAEMFIWHMARELKVKTKQKVRFIDLVEKIDFEHGGVANVPQIRKVNNARINFKHYGNLPSTGDMEKFISNTYAFLHLNAKKINIDFDNVSIADVIKDDFIKQCLKKSEKFRREGDLEEALINTSLAFDQIEKDAKNRVLDNYYSEMERIENMSFTWTDPERHEEFKFTDLLYKILDNLTEKISLSGLGYSIDYIDSMRASCFNVQVTTHGDIIAIHHKKNTKISDKNVLLLNGFITDLAIKLY